MKNLLSKPKIIFANTFFKQIKGLMFKRDFNDILIFTFKKPVKYSFHTLFMFFPIDIYFFLNKTLVEYYLDVKPWKIIKPKHKYNIVVEIKHNKFTKEEIEKLLSSLKLR